MIKKICLIIFLALFSNNIFAIQNNYATFASWIGGLSTPTDKGKLTAFPLFSFCQHNLLNVSNMLKYEDLPEVNSERWLSDKDFPNEVWENLPNTDGYQISNYGRVRSLDRNVVFPDKSMRHYKGRHLKPNVGTNGYLYVIVRNIGTLYIHRYVALIFVHNEDDTLEVDHINGIKTDNRATNLRWITHFENSSRANKGKKRNNSMGKNPRAKKVIGIYSGKIVETFECAKMVSIKYGVNYSYLKRYLQNGGLYIKNIYYKYGDKTT